MPKLQDLIQRLAKAIGPQSGRAQGVLPGRESERRPRGISLQGQVRHLPVLRNAFLIG